MIFFLFFKTNMYLTSTLTLHSPCCLGWRISSQTQRVLERVAAARVHTLHMLQTETSVACFNDETGSLNGSVIVMCAQIRLYTC